MTSQTNATQRARRATRTRIDYYPSPEALQAIEALRARRPVGSASATNSALIDALIAAADMEAAAAVSRSSPEFVDANARAYESERLPARSAEGQPGRELTTERKLARVRCGARRHRDGQPCEALSVPGRRRCRFHGGASTGPRTPEGKAKAAANLPRRARGND